MRELWELSGVTYNFSTTYHPQTNGLVEGFNKALEKHDGNSDREPQQELGSSAKVMVELQNLELTSFWVYWLSLHVNGE